MIFETTPSQTVGPYFAIGLPWPRRPARGRADGHAGRDPITRHGLRRRRRAGARPPDRDLAGRPRRALRRPPRLRRAVGARRASAASAAVAPRTATARFEILTVKPGPRARARAAPCRRRTSTCRCSRAGMLHRCVTRIYFADEPAGQRRPIRCSRDVPADAPRNAAGAARRTTATGSTSGCRGRARRSSLPSEGLLLAGIYARGAVAAQVSDEAWLQAMLDVEAALARACAAEGLISTRRPRRSPRRAWPSASTWATADARRLGTRPRWSGWSPPCARRVRRAASPAPSTSGRPARTSSTRR